MLGLFLLALGTAMAQAVPLGPDLPALAPYAQHKAAPIEWKKEIIYFLLVDRFAGEAIAPTSDLKKLKEFQGGNLKGVLAKLDYLKNLGITTIWLSPVMDNGDKDFMGWWPYHGYHPINHYQVDKHFGDMATLKKLVDEAHKKNLKIILDMVYNQVSPQHPWVNDAKNWEKKGFRYWFHPHSGKDSSTSIKNWNDQKELENKELSGLPDFNQDNPNVYNYLLDVSRFWINETHADGFRLDAVKHVHKSFWKKINADLHQQYGRDFLMLGEVFDGDPEYISKYQDSGFNALFDLPLYYAIANTFALGNSIEVISDALKKSGMFYGNNVLWSTLIDNHDVTRFSFKAQRDVSEKIKLALDFISALNGIPVLYYGTEVWLEGGAERDDSGNSTDFLNRRNMPWERVDGESQSGGIIFHLRKLFEARKTHPSLYDGKFFELYKDPCIYAFAKTSDAESTVVVFNNCNKNLNVTIPIRLDLFTSGTKLQDLLGEKQVQVENSRLALKIDGLQAYFFNGKTKQGFVSPKIDPFVASVERSDGDFVLQNFIYHPAKEVINSVSLAGEFNGWNPKKDLLIYKADKNIWEIKYPLKKGKHTYKFVVNGDKWVVDPLVKETENDGVGGRNSIIEVK